MKNSDFVSDLDVNNFIKEARTFYESKGTEESLEFYLIFYLSWFKNNWSWEIFNQTIICKICKKTKSSSRKISGNPKFKRTTIFRSTDLSTTAAVSEVEILSGISGISTSANYFILDLFVGFDDEEFITGTFDVTGKTKVIESVSSGSMLQ